jgi:hypothetical protein
MKLSLVVALGSLVAGAALAYSAVRPCAPVSVAPLASELAPVNVASRRTVAAPTFIQVPEQTIVSTVPHKAHKVASKGGECTDRTPGAVCLVRDLDQGIGAVEVCSCGGRS